MTFRSLMLVLLLAVAAPSFTATAASAAPVTTDEDRSLATLSLNTLTTSCNGGCKTNSACVVLGQSSENPIDCVRDARCATLLSGKAALCMEPFRASAGTWTFAPAKTSANAGVAPFERVGLVQVSDQVRAIEFKVASPALTPLNTLDVSSLNVQSTTTLEKVTFTDLILTGLDGALPINNALQVAIHNCRLQTIPTQFLASTKVASLDLTNNLLTTVATDFQSQTFPALTTLDLSRNALTSFSIAPTNVPLLSTLVLSNNQLREFPSSVFNLTALASLALDGNPLSTTALNFTLDQFAFLANLQSFTLFATTSNSNSNRNPIALVETDVCPTNDVVRKLNATFTFCVNATKQPPTATSSSSGNTPPAVVAPQLPGATPSPTSAGVVQTPNDPTDNASSSSSTLWIVLGAALACILLLAGVWLAYRRRREPRDAFPKRTAAPIGAPSTSLAIGLGYGDQSSMNSEHPYLELQAPSSSNCSQTTSDFELLANVADGYIGLTRLSYNDVFLHRMLRVSSRSELWFGAYLDAAVVIKKIKSHAASKTTMRTFVTEIEHMVALQHAHIAAFRGAMWDADNTELCAVVEFVERGALRDCVTASASKPTGASLALTPQQQVTIARDVVDALRYLHAKRIVHGRLTAFNVLLDAQLRAKLSLFAIFHYVQLSPLDAACRVFAAPEVRSGGHATAKSDMFSLGVLLVELVTGEDPVVNARRAMTTSQETTRANDAIMRMSGFSVGTHCAPMLQNVIAACVERDPLRRPTIDEVAGALQTKLSSLL